ncbi:MAG TPA: ABC transporter ATP-binding protein [Devosia sp.]|nr:ABC transporter ATP-binding protein [Devosia sp.]
MSKLLEVENLTLQFDTDEGRITAVDDVSFSIEAGEVMGLVGESGSGKSVTAKSVMKLNARNAIYGDKTKITLHLDDGPVDIMSLQTSNELQVVRGGAISMIFQEPMASFAPAISIGDQMTEQLQIHNDMSLKRATEISIEMLDRVGISDASTRFKQFAFELSGGMRQRAMIAMALSTKPKLLIADEPTTALDVTIQAQVIDLMKDLVKDFGMGIIFITHDLGVIAQTADKVAVMYLGRLVEQGPVRDVIRTPGHPYTKGLIAALPDLDRLDVPLAPIPGDIPSPLERPPGCVFNTRCSVAIEGRCNSEIPKFVSLDSDHRVACHVAEQEMAEAAAGKASKTKKSKTAKDKPAAGKSKKKSGEKNK